MALSATAAAADDAATPTPSPDAAVAETVPLTAVPAVTLAAPPASPIVEAALEGISMPAGTPWTAVPVPA
ncbi:MAG TPA: hypothetical protein VLT34_01180, partial [Arthrobacter sp.]|nr:hypothetical protein [Arthrobacter sp.]